MASTARRTKFPIHDSVKKALGYDIDMPDSAIRKDWKERTGRVCKPCWELKYCPYGPLVEQSPLLPALREGQVKHIEYFKKCLDTNLVGSIDKITAETRDQYLDWIADDQILFQQAVYELNHRATLESASAAETDEEKILNWLGGPLPPIHIYRAPYDVDEKSIVQDDYSPKDWKAIVTEAASIKAKYEQALQTGEIDNRSPLEPARAAWFRKVVSEFDENNYPDQIDPVFLAAGCNVFGHICPVFFAAEALTETSTERRRGRYIPFNVKMRVVRRDNYTCQHCGVHLKDDEVEFDHVIPVSKGGSSEEHNIRLTCFDCNRDKSDDYIP